MSDNFTPTDILIQYLDGQLSGEARQRVEEELKSSEALREELERLRAAQRTVLLYGLKEQVKGIHQEMVPGLRRPAPVVSMRRTVVRVAAAVIILLSAGVFYAYRQLTPARLYAENYSTFVLPTVRGADGSSELTKAYKKGDPRYVIAVFEQLPSPTIQDYFLAGNAYLNTGNPGRAIRAFESIREKNDREHTHLLQDDTEYYLAMSYLANNELKPAIDLFAHIRQEPSHLYHDKVGSWWLQRLRWAH